MKLSSLTRLIASALLINVFCSAMIAAQSTKRPEIIAHRGSSYTAPENTMAAVDLAWKQNADAVEVDVFLTADGQVICLHDGTTKRTTGIEWKPSDVSYEKLASLDAGSWKDPNYKGEPIPLLKDVIASIPEGKTLFVEVKIGPEIVGPLKSLIESSGKKEQITVICFSFETLEAVHEAMPDIPTKWLLGAPKNEETGEWLPVETEKVELARQVGFDGLNVSYHGASPELVKASREAGMELYVWTVNDVERARELAGMGIAGITTDRPAALLKAFEDQPAE